MRLMFDLISPRSSTMRRFCSAALRLSPSSRHAAVMAAAYVFGSSSGTRNPFFPCSIQVLFASMSRTMGNAPHAIASRSDADTPSDGTGETYTALLAR